MSQPRPAELREAAVRAAVLGARIAVAELPSEVEAQPLGQPLRLCHRLRVVAERAARLPRREQGGGGVARAAAPRSHPAPPPAAPPRAHPGGAGARVVGVRIAGRHRRHPEPLGERDEPAVPRAVTAPERPLQLDPEAIRAEGPQQPPRQEAAPAGSPRSQVPATAPSRAQPERQTSPSVWRSSSSIGSEGAGAPASACPPECPRCAPVISRQRLAQPLASSTSSVTCTGRGSRRGTSTVSSQPKIGRTPTPLQACANSIAPQTLS